MDQWPEWLGHDLIAGTLPWEQGLPTSLEAFLDRFTLERSEWIGLYTQPRQRATLLVRWEGAQEGPAPDWLLLAVRFDALDRVEVKLRHGDITTAVSGATSRAADLHRTHLEDRRGGGATLLHAPGVRLLCITRDRALLTLPVAAETL